MPPARAHSEVHAGLALAAGPQDGALGVVDTSAACFGSELPADEKWDAIRPLWRTPMQHRIWSAACFSALYPGMRPAVFEGSGGIAAFARRGLLPSLDLVGAVELAEPIEPLVANEASAIQLARAIFARRMPVRLGQAPADTAFSKAFLDLGRKRGVIQTRPTDGSPYIELGAAWTDALSQMNSRRRSDFRRMRRRAEESGEVAFQFHAPGPEQVADLLEQAIAVEARGWKSRHGTAIADNPAQQAFFRAYAPLAAAAGILRINLMTINGEAAAMQLAVESDDRYWLLKIGYDETYARSSPGQLLMLETIQRAAAVGLTSFEFLGKAAEWTRFWTTVERPRAAIYYYPKSILGLTALARDGAAVGLRRIRERLAARKMAGGTQS